MNIASKVSHLDMGNAAIDYLEQKYDMSFRVFSTETSSLDVPFDKIICECNDSDYGYITVYHHNDGSFHDDFYGVLHLDEYKNELVRPIVQKFVDKTKIYCNFNASFFNDTLDKDVRLEEAIVQSPSDFYGYVDIYIRESEGFDKISFEALCEELEKTIPKTKIYVYMFSDDIFEKLNENERAYVQMKSIIDPKYILEENYSNVE